MKKLLCLCAAAFTFVSISAQFVATLELTETIEGICNEKAVYAIFPSLEGQEEAICPLTKDEILVELNAKVQFIKDNPKFKSKGMMGVIINCKGEVVKCKMNNKTKSKALDAQIEAVFATLVEWKPAKLYQEPVDSSLLYSFKVKKGKIYWD